MPMTDDELAAYCGFKPTDPPEAIHRFLREMTPAKRETIEKMREVEMWDASDGALPLPAGVLIDTPKRMRRWVGKEEK